MHGGGTRITRLELLQTALQLVGAYLGLFLVQLQGLVLGDELLYMLSVGDLHFLVNALRTRVAVLTDSHCESATLVCVNTERWQVDRSSW